MLLEQNDETGWYTELYENGKRVATLLNTHDPRLCEGRGCAIHNHPSAHPLNMQPLNWRDDRGILERICIHGVGHPDSDSAAYLMSIGQDAQNVHGCDGCC